MHANTAANYTETRGQHPQLSVNPKDVTLHQIKMILFSLILFNTRSLKREIASEKYYIEVSLIVENRRLQESRTCSIDLFSF